MKTPLLQVCFLTSLLFIGSTAPALHSDRNTSFTPNVYAESSWTDSAVVATSLGNVRGHEDNHTTWTWKAIPFAKPPVGELRWQAPQNPDPWEETRQSEEFCSMCPQMSTENGTSVLKGSEDCLYLNIWRPRSTDTDLPVYLWIHGGANRVGSADPYIAALLAGSQNLVVVTINYRLGPLGWFTHPALRDAQDNISGSGNYALLDIIKSLEWVRDNIEAFGGNPNNVTVAGESAGGVNNLLLMIAPQASDLFHRVISQSGGTDMNTPTDGDEYANSVIEALLVADGTADDQAAGKQEQMSPDEIRTYLRSKTTEDFFAATTVAGRSPDVFKDGIVIPTEGADAFNDPETYYQVPIIIGTTAEEGKLFMYLFGFHEFFPPFLYQSMGKGLTWFTRSTGLDSLAYKLSSHDSQPGVYSYIFAYGMYRMFGYNAWPTDTGPSENMSWAMALGAAHALDIPFNFALFDSFPLFGGLGDVIFREDNRAGWEALSETIMSYNAQFARSGDPNLNGFPDWTPWPSSPFFFGQRFMIFDADDDGDTSHMAYDVY